MKRADFHPQHDFPECSDRTPVCYSACQRCAAIIADDRDALRSALERIAATCPGRPAEVARTALMQTGFIR